MSPRFVCTDVISASAVSATITILRCRSSRLRDSSDAITAPAGNRAASFAPVLIERTAVLIRLTDPSLATDFAFN